LFRAIRSASKGEATFGPTVAQTVARRLANTADDTLTEREIEVLTLASRGNSNKEIAGALHITNATVKSHFVHIFDKLGVNDRTAAVTTAIERKIIRLK
jgi:DNA-binding NarL/FixJ family response regulator